MSKLTAFTEKTLEAPAVQEKKRGARAQGKLVGVTIRIPRDSWKRLRAFADDEGSSIQALAMQGMSKMLEEKGLKPL
jgi:hypothetical protein